MENEKNNVINSETDTKKQSIMNTLISLEKTQGETYKRSDKKGVTGRFILS